MPRKGKEKKNLQRQCASIHGHFRQLSNLIFSLKFSLHFGEKTFWWVQKENTQAPLFILLPFHQALRAYSDHYWELYNEIEGDNGGIATSTFKVGLSIDYEFIAFLALKLVIDMNKLMEQVEEYKRLEDDQLQDKPKAKAPTVEKKEVKANQAQ